MLKQVIENKDWAKLLRPKKLLLNQLMEQIEEIYSARHA